MNWTAEQIAAMQATHPVHRDSTQDNALAWLRTGEETGGEYSLLHSDSSPGFGVFPHFHTRYTETFRVLDGALDVRISGTARRLASGDEATVPLRAVHEWHVTEDGRAQFLVEVRPAFPPFEKWLAVLQAMANDGLTHPDGRPRQLSHAALILVDSDIHLTGPARAAMPLLHLVAARARRRGVDRQLEQRYWRAP
ncbi:cupin domain-containing protein [Kocuria flava]|uniref:cupin domain-containing protein n=1 Tax=Kocuria flava TaxID=446860 RepID=UPI001FF19AFB|nr:cupin domain-containing protein [Kocuria flava]MCJ8504827.1 cupin domain-containing protein [Kocuria flava]